jgi:acyl-coenzyme A synthetase/AMP-(fatty) acid ligase
VIASPAHLSRISPVGSITVVRVFSSGAPLPDAAVLDCHRVFGQAPIEVYGSSETGGVAWRQRNPNKASQWQALPGVIWKIENDTLWLRSPYLGTTGWLPSGDLAAEVRNGFELRGRTDRLVKIAEKRVSLFAIETALRASPLLSDVRLLLLAEPREQIAVVAVPSEDGWAILESDGKRTLTDALREVLSPIVERVVLPRRLRFVA